jgi:sortase B
MDKGVMFGEIGDFMDRDYFDFREYGAMYYGDRWHGLQFFAFLHVDAYDGAVFRVNIDGREEQREYLDRLLDMAVYTRDVGVTTEDRIVLLSTCSPIPTPTNGRDILIGRITDDVYDDPFAAEDGTDSVGDETAAAKTDWPRLIIILTTIAAAAILAIALNHRRRRRQRRREGEGQGGNVLTDSGRSRAAGDGKRRFLEGKDD